MVIGFEFCYSERVYLSCHDSYGNEMVKFSNGFMTMDKAIEAANTLIEEFGFCEVACCNAATGEIIFIARAHDDECVEEVDDYWDECGFDPYEGCYTFDC